MFPAGDFSDLLQQARAALADIAHASDVEIRNACTAIANLSDDHREVARAGDLLVLVQGEATPAHLDRRTLETLLGNPGSAQ